MITLSWSTLGVYSINELYLSIRNGNSSKLLSETENRNPISPFNPCYKITSKEEKTRIDSN